MPKPKEGSDGADWSISVGKSRDRHFRAHAATMNRPKGQPIVIAIMGGVAGYVLCGEALRRVDASMDSSVIRFFSALAGIVFVGIAWKIG